MVAIFIVYFEGPFWVGVLESEDEGRLVVARQVFGSEPSNPELLEFMLYRFSEMPRSRPRESQCPLPRAAANPKRAQREARRAQAKPPSTRSQAALSAALEEGKSERRAISRADRRLEAERRFELRTEKRKRRRDGH